MDSLAILVIAVALIAAAENHFVKKPIISGALTNFISRSYTHYFGTAFVMSIASFGLAYGATIFFQLSWAAVTWDLYVSATAIFFVGLAWCVFGGAADVATLAGIRQVDQFGAVKLVRSENSGLPLWLSLLVFNAMFVAIEYGIFLMKPLHH